MKSFLTDEMLARQLLAIAKEAMPHEPEKDRTARKQEAFVRAESQEEALAERIGMLP